MIIRQILILFITQFNTIEPNILKMMTFHLGKFKQWFNLYSVCHNTRAVSKCFHERVVKTSV